MFWLNPIVNFIFPCAILLKERAKRSRSVLFQVSLVILAGRWLDIYLMIEPTSGRSPSFPVFSVAATALVIGVMVWVGQRSLRGEERK